MKVLVTGANGFTGRYVTAALQRRGDEVVALASDIIDAPALSDEIADIAPDAVLHLAALAFVQSDDFAAYYSVNQVGTLNLLAALASTKRCTKVVLASSAQVYGAASGVVNELHPTKPTNHYALSKLAMEWGANLAAPKLQIVIARPFNYTGRGQEERYLIPKIVAHFRRRDPVIELGNINVQRDFGDVRSVAAAYVGLLHAPLDCGPVNIATGRLASVRDIIEIARAVTGHEIEVTVNPHFVRDDDVEILGGETSRCRRLLPDWQPGRLEDTIKWMLEDVTVTR